MNEKEKYIEVEERRFVVRKFPAKTALKMTLLLSSKALPAISGFKDGVVQSSDGDNALLFDGIGKALDNLSEKDLDKVIDTALLYCAESLKAGQTTVLNNDGSFGVAGVEDDMLLMLRLVIEVLIFNFENFLEGSRWGSMFKPITDTLPFNAQM